MQGKLKYEETVTVGFDNMFDAFLGLFTGANIQERQSSKPEHILCLFSVTDVSNTCR